jgi:D-alanyl-D-alanine carboxypeptidase
MVCFGTTEAGIWLAENAHKYGFIVRYQRGYKAITGFQYEPWHFRYVGVELATEMHTKGIMTLEEFWSLEVSPEYLAPTG